MAMCAGPESPDTSKSNAEIAATNWRKPGKSPRFADGASSRQRSARSSSPAVGRITGANPSAFSPDGASKASIEGLDANRLPVDSVTWDEANDFCRKLSEAPAEKQAGRTYRLPTEAD